MRADSHGRPGPLVALCADAIVVVAFVVVGRRSHDEGSGLGVTLEVSAPFLLALGAGWLAARAWQTPRAIGTGVRVWAVTMVLGLGLRRLVFDRGVAAAFVIVSCLFFLVGVVGWRIAAQRIAPPATPSVGS